MSMTVAELREALVGLDGEMQVVLATTDGYADCLASVVVEAGWFDDPHCALMGREVAFEGEN